jgi:IclR family transcriptional regulator, acetate operon repressor
MYLDRIEAKHWPLRLQFSSGSRVPLHCSAIGKLFLAFTPASRRRRLLQHLDLRRYTEQTIVDPASLEAELRQIRKQQVSYDREEFLDGVVCIAVPVLGRNGELLAGVAIQAPQARMGIEDSRAHLPVLRATADELAEIFQAVD